MTSGGPAHQCLRWTGRRYVVGMGLFVILVILALVFGIGAVIKGLLWLVLIAAVLAIAAFVAGYQWVRNRL